MSISVSKCLRNRWRIWSYLCIPDAFALLLLKVIIYGDVGREVAIPIASSLLHLRIPKINFLRMPKPFRLGQQRLQ